MKLCCHKRWLLAAIAIFLAMAPAGRAWAEDSYFIKRIGDLIDLGQVPGADGDRWYTGFLWLDQQSMFPYVALNGPGEAFVQRTERPRNQRGLPLEGLTIGISAPEGADVRGRIFVPRFEERGMVAAEFTIAAADGDEAHREDFLDIKLAHYERLQRRNIPGGAWFRHQVRQTRQARGAKADEDADDARAQRNRSATPNEMERTFALISGGRALSENLQLDRILPASEAGVKTVDVDSIDGITVREFDWAPLVDGIEPETDPLAAIVPDDQHALFFPTFEALIDLVDNADAQGTPVLRAMEPRAENALVHQRYERQLGLPLSVLARKMGPLLVKSVALTGSDPYLRTGSDVAVLFEARNPLPLQAAIAGSVAQVIEGVEEVERMTGNVQGVEYAGMRTPDRGICSYMAALNEIVIVTNSLIQLERIIAVWKGDAPSLASLDEYTFFRDRYPRGVGGETALLVVSDKTIRRWCGPRWRIGTSRRTRAVAVMTDIQAAYLDRLAAGTVRAGPVHTAHPLAEDDGMRLMPGGVASAVFGTLEFQTPIAELDINRVTQQEADFYKIWRDRYQYRWRNFFDPIAVQFHTGDERLAVDVTVMPLIEGTDYGQIRTLSGEAVIPPDAGDRHESSILHWAMAIDRNSPMVQMYSGMAAGMAPGLKVDPLGWFGGTIAAYADDDPVWAELAAADDPEEFFQANPHRLPVVVHAEVSSGLRLAAFLTGVRAFIDQTAPGLTVWQNLTHNDVPYVKITASEMAKAEEEMMEHFAICYAASGEALIITLHEETLKHAIDRQVDRRSAKVEGTLPPETEPPWLGENLSLQATRGVLPLLAVMYSETHQRRMQHAAWGNIPILNEWKRLYPDRDPVTFQQQFWQRRLVCPGGGTYEWNESWQTMESTVYGHPGDPKDGPPLPSALQPVQAVNAGLTFEDNGLRAKVEMERERPEP